MAKDYTLTEDNGTTTTKTTYSCTKKSLQYTIIGDDIKGDFDFLTSDIVNKVQEALNYVKAASEIADAFYFENGSTVNDISDAYGKINDEVTIMVSCLNNLHDAFITDIDNINAELKTNFGHWIFGKAVVANRTTTTNSTN